ncbi:MAG TPA: LPS assembly lipoprotein LptE [Burkholderiaceae bacterium]|jgi:LPS-assembly lipoprotein|nr:LPS assembly lipoprotein LptE [Burkholderiaceae bacterium]
MWSPERRRALRGLALAGAAASLASCGFKLRRPPELHFRTVQFVGFDRRSEFARELQRNIEASGSTRVVEAASQAQVILLVIADRRERIVTAQAAAGQVREFAVRTRFNFALRTPGGRELIGPTELLLERAMTYNETDALAKEKEEEMLWRAMQTDIVDQVMRRLAAVPAV